MIDTRFTELQGATRLVRGGKLAEATATLQRLLQGDGFAGITCLRPQTPDPQCIRADPAGGGDLSRLPDTLRDVLGRLRVGGGSTRPVPICEPIPPGAQFLDGAFANGSGGRTYKLYIPSNYRGQAMPLIVMLHGCTQSPEDFAAGTGMNRLAEQQGCLVVYPAQSASANVSRCWQWFDAADQQRDRGEPALIAGITRQVMEEYAVDPRQVFVAGLSAGGAAAAVMAATYPDLYAAVGVHSGLAHGAATDLPSALAAMRNGGSGGVRGPRPDRLVPTIVFHGDQDRVVHPRNGDAIIAKARDCREAGLQPTATVLHGEAPGGRPYSRTIHADMEGRPVLEHWVIHGAGHAWSGGSAAGSYTDPHGPDAAAEMFRFFLANPHPGVE